MSTKILFIIPSKQRAEVFAKYTFRWLKNSGVDYVVMLEKPDVEAYKAIGLDGEHIITMLKLNQGLGYSLQTGKEYAEHMGYDAIFKLDDDIIWFSLRGVHMKKDPEERTQQFTDSFKYALKLTQQILDKKPKVGAVCFPYRNQMYEKKDYELNKKLQTAYAVRLNVYKPIPQISSQEDYYAYITVRKAGYSTVRLSNIGIDLGIEVGQGEGGLQSEVFNRQEMAGKEVRLIQSMFSGIAIKKKPGTSWGYEIDFKRTKL